MPVDAIAPPTSDHGYIAPLLSKKTVPSVKKTANIKRITDAGNDNPFSNK